MPQALASLKAGDKIALIAPANAFNEERLIRGCQEIERAGFVPFVPVATKRIYGRFSGTDDERRQALEDVFTDNSVRAILCCRGGYGTQRYIDDINYELIRAHPKPFVGYSDATTLINAIAERCDFPTFHGPMITDLSTHDSAQSWQHLWALLKGERIMPSDLPAFKKQCEVIVPGEASGKLWGGNLSLLATSCGTKTATPTGGILFIEEIGSDLYQFDRMLVQLSRSGLLETLKGVLINSLDGVEDKGPPAFGMTPKDLTLSHFMTRGIPIIYNVPAGHCCHRTTLPIGIDVTLEAKNNQIKLTHAPLFY